MLRMKAWTFAVSFAALACVASFLFSCSLSDGEEEQHETGEISVPDGFTGDENLNAANNEARLSKLADSIDGVSLNDIMEFISGRTKDDPDAKVTVSDLLEWIKSRSAPSSSDPSDPPYSPENTTQGESGEVPSGALPGLFSINADGDQVRFSRGNLYWNGGAYDFERQQYDFRLWGGDKAVINGQITQSPSNSRGIFLWTTYPEKAYSEETYLEIKALYDELGNLNTKCYPVLGITGDNDVFFANKDSVKGSEWTALSEDEWNYLIFGRDDATDKCKSFKIPGSGIEFYILLPDEFSFPNESIESKWNNANYWEYIGDDDWRLMENNGAVALATPSEGFLGDAVKARFSWFGSATYWTSTLNNYNGYSPAYIDVLGGTGLKVSDGRFSPIGNPNHNMVRLVNRIK